MLSSSKKNQRLSPKNRWRKPHLQLRPGASCSVLESTNQRGISSLYPSNSSSQSMRALLGRLPSTRTQAPRLLQNESRLRKVSPLVASWERVPRHPVDSANFSSRRRRATKMIPGCARCLSWLACAGRI